MANTDDIKNHRRVLLTEINVLRRLCLTYEECADETTIRRFCASNGRTLPDMIQITVDSCDEDDGLYEWHVQVWESPNSPEPSRA